MLSQRICCFICLHYNFKCFSVLGLGLEVNLRQSLFSSAAAAVAYYRKSLNFYFILRVNLCCLTSCCKDFYDPFVTIFCLRIIQKIPSVFCCLHFFCLFVCFANSNLLAGNPLIVSSRTNCIILRTSF